MVFSTIFITLSSGLFSISRALVSISVVRGLHGAHIIHPSGSHCQIFLLDDVEAPTLVIVLSCPVSFLYGMSDVP
jgi:hypothetical protein